ncbi:hypothetical protein HN51_005742 [Arachis hypogaea]|uniref:Uncharacterized protein n=2 Tax=Arachis TaxID=3817 RepID=A0A445DDJ2_ARAHY|nr:uncharacterized protein LOC107485636 [Arachis duranensis]XP_025696110.1 uncharacterized protein LOC112797412 [Arachis hypogaea]QHO39544.1 uncharacterized protein DS421_4g130060 [Arachis hypogaea]RYR61215.1 hypothetical protein Ahy_A04g018354 [Arachis hypogaea]
MMAPNKTSEVVDTHEATWSSQTDDLELESLESELKQMAHKILEHRSTLPDQLKSTLLSILDAHRPLFPHPSHHASTPPGALDHNIYQSEGSPAPEDPETAKKVKLLNEKITQNCSTMPVILKRMKDCIARIEKLDSYNAAVIHPAFKAKKTG